MERLDFASVMAVLRRNIPDENFGNQADFLDSYFWTWDSARRRLWNLIRDRFAGGSMAWQKLEPPVQKRPVRHQPEPGQKPPKRDYER